jgi:VanZ family protein
VTTGDRAKAASSWLAVLVWIALIATFSGEGFSEASTSRFIDPLVRWLLPNVSAEMLAAIHFAIRKFAHAAEYAVLALLAFHALRWSFDRSFRRSAGLALAIVLAVGSADEANQARLAARTGSPWDVALDLAGGVAALGGLLALRRRTGGRFVSPTAASSR